MWEDAAAAAARGGRAGFRAVVKARLAVARRRQGSSPRRMLRTAPRLRAVGTAQGRMACCGGLVESCLLGQSIAEIGRSYAWAGVSRLWFRLGGEDGEGLPEVAV